MRTIAVLSLAALAIATGTALSPGLRAQEAPAPQRPGMTDHGAMSQMMDQCNRMMQSMMDRQAPKDQNTPQGTPPTNPDRKG